MLTGRRWYACKNKLEKTYEKNYKRGDRRMKYKYGVLPAEKNGGNSEVRP